MPIEFRCTQCGKLLRTPDGTGGQQAKCPACGAVVEVPASDRMPSQDSGLEGQDPFGGSASRAGGEPLNPYQAPGQVVAGATPFPCPTPLGGIRPTRIQFADVFSDTWTIFTNQFLLCFGAVLAWLVLSLLPIVVAVAAVMVAGGVTQNVAAVVLTGAFAISLGLIFVTWITVGLQLLFIKLARGAETGIGDLFAGGPYFLRYLGGTILYQLALSVILGVCVAPCVLTGLAIDEDAAVAGLVIGMLLAAFPAAVFSLTFYQYYFLIIDQNMGIVDSFSTSRRITSGNRLTMLLILLVMMIVSSVINHVTCGLGTIVTTPFAFLLSAVMYVMMIGHPTAAQQVRQIDQPPAPGA